MLVGTGMNTTCSFFI